jgi:hypothetical protein
LGDFRVTLAKHTSECKGFVGSHRFACADHGRGSIPDCAARSELLIGFRRNPMMNVALIVPFLLLIPLLINTVFAIWAIVELRRRTLDDTILVAPFLGLIAFLVMQPGKQFSSE